MSDSPHEAVLPFDDERCREVALAGGKGASLATMTAHGLPVPPGFVITSAAFAAAVDGDALLGHLRAQDLDAARAVVAAAEPPRALVEEHLGRLPEGCSVAVRSSACAEDGEDASYAGQQETYLFVTTVEEVLTRVVDCWLSFFSERAVFYREHKGDLDDIAMAVVVQQMVDATKAGVMFTVDPVNRRRDRLVVEAAPGIGEHVVSGEVTPDYYTLDRKGTVKRSRIVDEQVLSADELADLAAMGLRLAELNGVPQDIEWAYDERGLHMLQSRPITTSVASGTLAAATGGHQCAHPGGHAAGAGL
ncbi:PEP/pyruvate-binding domain-containing protein [Nocardioides sp. CFH 31398]|uniref:PEP/pyruvate-binding domain-containing protein n=1 Tax=Nocardioides sp. CFH 31398 TaxID=2919579 RepID=UPI001F053EAF|nr:PEP/pyruvate-binding domain-containing protein [Nocardioides sp. CFH 31398]MCH1867826.1 pyruvate, water dikinase [Nocardioides sp. CFH 31398]